ncbi:hypothetical protein BCF59_0170 [Mycoplasmopsis mustelae]|uniref:Lipoprotein n=1 Tax=Mycoplasmopsis mustelae TaxID=171289 RepID=A0A4R7UCU6_9BACT|nr:hypothetical protein [Mycoplasmopsis mustelae]TDV24219.1 hypothetical protein BCF59_0170 [Mycoplasmopsis mustelae]
MKSKKLLILSSSAFSIGALSVAVSCGSPTTGKNSKDIYVAVDGAQKDFYNEVKKIFDETDAHKKDGFELKFITKGVFDALNLGTVGLNDQTVPDIFYLPQDRVTEFVQNNYLVDLDKFFGKTNGENGESNILETIKTETQLTDNQLPELRTFGTVTGSNKTGDKTLSKFVGIRHNKEGIVLASAKDKEATIKELNNKNTDTLKELVEQGKVILRLQDFWYGNGILYGGIQKAWDNLPDDQKEFYGQDLKDSFYSKNLYKKDDGKVSSWFLKDDKYHPLLKQGLTAVADVLWPVIQAAYFMSADEFKNTPWGKNGLSQGDLQGMYITDLNQVNNSIFNAITNKKLEYALIGTWDVQNARQAANAKSFFNVVNIDDNEEYRQAQGAWLYAISSRNNGSSDLRKKALEEVIKAAFKTESYYKYFKQDSKVPFSQAIQTQIEEKIQQENSPQLKVINDFAKSLGYTDYQDLKQTFGETIKKLSVSKSWDGNFNNWGTWENLSNSNKPDADANLISKTKMVSTAELQGEYAAKLKEVNDSQLDALPLRNTVAALLGLSTDWSKMLVGNGQSWQVSESLLKSGAWEKLTSEDALKKYGNVNLVQEKKEGNKLGTFHVRKIEKFIFGVDGDSESEKQALLDEIIAAMKNNTLKQLKDKIFANAKFFSNTASKTTVSDAEIKKVVDLYLNSYINFARIYAVVDEYIANTKMKKKDQTDSNVTIAETDAKIQTYEKFLSINFVFDVLTSKTSIKDNGIGILKVQPSRFDNSNPQLSSVWTNWNDKTFGNQEWYKGLKNINTKEDFINAMEDKLSANYTETVNTFNTQNSNVRVVFTDK